MQHHGACPRVLCIVPLLEHVLARSSSQTKAIVGAKFYGKNEQKNKKTELREFSKKNLSSGNLQGATIRNISILKN
jgi:hypothetical protein